MSTTGPAAGPPAEAPVPAATPRPAATVMLLRDGDRGPEVLLLQRASGTPFVPGAHVFPGGAVDPGDAADGLGDVLAGRTADEASALLGVEQGGAAYFLTAVRECIEEVGVVLARDEQGRPVDGRHPVFERLAEVRAELEAGTTTLAELYRYHRLRAPVGDLAYVGRRVTPEGSPRRYDARFFAAPMPAGQHARPDGWEAVDAGWWRPADALSDWQAARIDLIEPTVASLEILTRFRSAAEAMAALHAGATIGRSTG